MQIDKRSAYSAFERIAAPDPGGATLAPRSSPTARRRRLATALRQLREERNLNCTDAGKAVGWSESKVSRIETGRVKIAQPDLERLLDLYEVTGETRAGLLSLARQATHRGWWRSYSDALPRWFENYVGLENGAKSLFTYQNQLVHGLMQTEEYAEAVIRAAQPQASADEIERQLGARATRQALLTASTPLQVWAVLDEAVLHRSVGGRTTMRDQLNRLIEISAFRNVTLQVLPFDAGAHASMGTSFELLHFPELGDTAIVYIEDLTSSQYLEMPVDLERYTLVFDYLRATALSPDRSAELIAQVATGMT
jgi:transcriptional regulator with XRE-family HTH domain